LPPRGQALYWVGLKNNTRADRAFCRLGITYFIDLPSGETLFRSAKGYPTIGSPHRCPAGSGNLVLAGETHFVEVEVVFPEEAEPNSEVRFEVTGQDTCMDDADCKQADIHVMQVAPTSGRR